MNNISIDWISEVLDKFRKGRKCWELFGVFLSGRGNLKVQEKCIESVMCIFVYSLHYLIHFTPKLTCENNVEQKLMLVIF
jgi:hypothetical protein